MRKIYLSAGHSNTKGRDMGALGNGYIEGVLMVQFRKKVADKLLSKYGIKAILDGDNTILSESINFFKKITDSNCILVDFHLNSFNETSTGVETLIPNSFSDFELKLAGNLSQAISTTMGGITLRGVTNGVKGVKTESSSQHKSLGWMRLIGENVLPELCFISNPKEVKKFVTDMDIIAEAVADELAFASVGWDKSKLLVNDAKISTPKQPNTIVGTTHVVVSGDTLSKLAIKYDVSVLSIMQLNKKSDTIIRIGEVLKIK